MILKNDKYSESALVERPAIALFSQLGWSVQNCFHGFGENGKSFLGRETKVDVVLVSKLKPALKKINPSLSETVLDEAIKILTANRNLMEMVSANREVFDSLKNGVLVSYPCSEAGIGLNNKNEHVSERVQIIDWVNIENNDFFLASQFWILGEIYTRRANLIGFVNGILLLFMELKAFHRNIKKSL